ncbi:hypothetical protein CC1G_14604 [Coprinopsis cinerea okayama7|uniref:Peroxisome membrane anchor protein Pex14p N-terminal domain-containing protein n=1 Tax=Coprinopsis cinerea (strain Okayama-7 / 130 / ATCC MYA-4618 / FGSC 9003) TaxID=240176 RepID=D6RMH8_COPC7|nr:hypothetical protein CC1G_14604 [Coprinopsis cinerea okayama7\|eukprot:XP_002911173.1 hypothetical protein CC1G_14604 [Coprinopsis cinerea okayama7\
MTDSAPSSSPKSESSNSSEQQPTGQPKNQQQEPTQSPSTVPSADIVDRRDLITKARVFLNSPQIQYQDPTAKRRFLVEKGLREDEIEGLLREQAYAPVIPPRTYPQAPPSNLPTLLLGLARLFSWLGMGSVALIFVYYRFLLPKITRTAQARHSLRTHHISLMQKLTASLASLKEAQTQSLAELPRHDPYHERPQFAKCRTLSQVLKTLGDGEPDYSQIPPVTLLRCAISELAKGKTGDEALPSTEEVFLILEGKIPWLASPEAYDFKKKVYDTLLECPRFVEVNRKDRGDDTPAALKWKYEAPPPVEPSPLVQSLSRLESAVPKQQEPRSSVFQHTLETLTEITGYISSQVYVPYRPPPGGLGFSGSYGLSPAEEALKKEIRALKGLALNRYAICRAHRGDY